MDDIHVFWKQFREAVLNSDSIMLLQLTHFPVIIHGHLDEDPQLKIVKNQFYSVFKKNVLPAEALYINDKIESNIDYIRMNETFVNNNDEPVNSPLKRSGNLVFNKTNAGWKLKELYADTNELQSKNEIILAD